MPSQPRIQWQELANAERPSLWTPGWLPDSDALRWSLANHMRVEGICDGWRESYAQADAVSIQEGYVAENDDGEWVEVSPRGVGEADGVTYADFRPATFVRLLPVVE